MARAIADTSLADRILDYGCTLTIGTGDLVGQPFRWMPFQIAFIQDVFRDDSPVEIANLSLGRGNGKTATAGVLALAAVSGPLYRPSGLAISCSRSHKQAGLIWRWANMTAHASGIAYKFQWQKVSKSFCIHPSLTSPDLNASFMAISADATTALGERPWLVFHDELGSVEGPSDDLYEAISTGATLANTLEINLSTQAATDDALYSELLDRGLSGEDPTIVSHLYAADEDDDPSDPATWRKANPGLGVSVDSETMRKKAERAVAMPSRMVSFEHLNLNRRIHHAEVWIGTDRWRACSDPADPEVLATGRVWGGLDLASREDLVALVLLAEAPDSRFHVFPFFWTPETGLQERSSGALPLAAWVRSGHLETCPGRSINLAVVAEHIEAVTADIDLQHVQYDRYKIEHLRREFELIESRLGWDSDDDEDPELLLRPCGQGYIGMGPAVEWAEYLITERKICHGGHPVLTANMLGARVDRDPAGNGKLNKKKSTIKIDGAVAFAMAAKAACFELEIEPELFEPIFL